MDNAWKKINKRYKLSKTAKSKIECLLNFCKYYNLNNQIQDKVLGYYEHHLAHPYVFDSDVKYDLIVDDDYGNRLVMKLMLKKYNQKFDFAQNGLEALEKILMLSSVEGQHHHYLWIDIKMPYIQGDCLIDLLRTFFDYTKPIYAVTAYSDEGSRNKYLQIGVNGIINKPIDIADIETALKKID